MGCEGMRGAKDAPTGLEGAGGEPDGKPRREGHVDVWGCQVGSQRQEAGVERQRLGIIWYRLY